MIKYVLSFVAVLMTQVTLAGECNKDSLTRAQKLYDVTKERYEKGVLTLSPYKEATIFLLEQKFCMNEISMGQYCLDAQVARKELVTSMQAAFAAGIVNLTDVTSAIEKLAALENYCALPSADTWDEDANH